jgi:hypothetical protein
MAWFPLPFPIDPANRRGISFDNKATKAFRNSLLEPVIGARGGSTSILASATFTVHPGSARAFKSGNGIGAPCGYSYRAIEQSHYYPYN